jgi:hypothetical protein
LAWFGFLAWLGLAWLGLAWPGLAWHGLAWPGLAWFGLAWRGLAWLGLAWLGLAWLGLASFIETWRKKSSTLHEDQYTFLITSRSILLEREILHIKIAQNFKTRALYSITAFQNRAVYEIMWGKLWYSRTGHR